MSPLSNVNIAGEIHPDASSNSISSSPSPSGDLPALHAAPAAARDGVRAARARQQRRGLLGAHLRLRHRGGGRGAVQGRGGTPKILSLSAYLCSLVIFFDKLVVFEVIVPPCGDLSLVSVVNSTNYSAILFRQRTKILMKLCVSVPFHKKNHHELNQPSCYQRSKPWQA